jgi:ATP-dependent Lon protease
MRTTWKNFSATRRSFPKRRRKSPRFGIATGLAWTPVGGDILFIEATRMRGRGNLILTGSLGEVMKESAQTAVSYLRSQAKKLDMDLSDYGKFDLHIHVPAGATPKDGPSAGVAIVAALASLLTKRRCVRTRDDRRNQPARPRAARGRHQGKSAGRARFGLKQVILPEGNKSRLAGSAGGSAREIEGPFRAQR